MNALSNETPYSNKLQDTLVLPLVTKLQGHDVVIYSYAQDSSIVQNLIELDYCIKERDSHINEIISYQNIIENQNIELIEASNKLKDYEDIVERYKSKEKLYKQVEQSCILLKESYKAEALDSQKRLENQIKLNRGIAISGGITVVALLTAVIITSIQN